jgi:hypothetical protein
MHRMAPRATSLAIFAAAVLSACNPATKLESEGAEAKQAPLSDAGASSDLTQWDALSTQGKEQAIAMMGGGDEYANSPEATYLSAVLACANARRLELDDRSEIATLIGFCTGANSSSSGVHRLRFANGREWQSANPEDRRAVLREYFFMTIAMSAQTGGKASELTIDSVSDCVTKAGGRPDGQLRAIVDLVSECETPAS